MIRGILNETTATLYYYEMPDALWQELCKLNKEELNELFEPIELPSDFDKEAKDVLDGVQKFAEKKGFNPESVYEIDLETIDIEPGWA